MASEAWCIGDEVLANGKPGVVRYVGPTNFSHGLWIGVEFIRHVAGRNDGSVNGVRYFGPCRHGYGLFLRADSPHLQQFTASQGAAIAIQARVKANQQRDQSRYDATVNLINRLESEEEEAYLQENDVVAGVESYLQRRFPQEQNSSKNKMNKKRLSLSQSQSKPGDGSPESWKTRLGFEINPSKMTMQAAISVIQWIKQHPGQVLPCDLVMAILEQAHHLYMTSITSTLQEMEPPQDGSLHIVGDTHGQLPDLLWIFYKYGLPSPTNMYLINGDMADRVPSAMEIILILLCFQLADSTCVRINRGNHEDANMNEMDRSAGGGFALECRSKYGAQIYCKMEMIFNLLPLATVISQKIMVVHGGLCRSPGVTLDMIRRLPRNRTCPESPSKLSEWIFFDLLWADPQDARGKGRSRRGPDCFAFGPDVTRSFLQRNHLDLVVRSHELPGQGRGYRMQHGETLVTVFSASNYCDLQNYGAIMTVNKALEYQFFEHWAPQVDELLQLEYETAQATKAVQDKMHELTEKEQAQRQQKRRSTVSALNQDVLDKVKVKVCQHKEDLWFWFEGHDTTKRGSLPVQTMRDGLTHIIGDYYPWVEVVQKLHIQVDTSGEVNYRQFLQRFRVELDGVNATSWRREAVSKVFKAILRSDLPLRSIFALFDRNCDGSVSYSEFCDILTTFELGLTPVQMETFYRSILSATELQTSTSDLLQINVTEFLKRFDIIFRTGSTPQAEPWMDEALTAIGRELLGRPNDTDEEERASLLLEFFETADDNNDGFLSVDELLKAFKKLPSSHLNLPFALDDEKLTQLITHMDLSKTGRINYIEMVHAFMAVDVRDDGKWMEDVLDRMITILYMNRRSLRRAVQYFDAELTGQCTPESLSNALKSLSAALAKPDPPFTEEQIKVLVKHVEIDEDTNLVDYEDLLDSFMLVDTLCKETEDGQTQTPWRKRCSVIGQLSVGHLGSDG